MTQRVFNFSAGPAVLPLPVLEEIQRDMLCLPGVGSSLLEISHRSATFKAIQADAQARIVDLLKIPDTHEVLFLQGGSRLQFSMVAMNLLRGSGKSADYITTGTWGKKSQEEAVKEGNINVVWDGKDGNYNRIPTQDELKLDSNAAYAYLTSNETIQGVQFLDEIETGGVPLVADCSSDIFCRPLPIEKYGLIYACAQKNAGPAGVTLVIIRKDLMDNADPNLPGYLSYKNHADNDSMYNTPPTFGIYAMGLIAKWLQEEIGGLDKMLEINKAKSQMLYDVIDRSNGFYTGHAQPESRSIMNVTFKLPSDEIQDRFIKQAADRNLQSLKGHRSVGGIRASIYNAMPVEGVTALRDLMQEFCEAESK
ncbi:MAG: 3-phosphoserine/phosphohydroxythreonine transaminase [Pirellulales bacterium]